MRPKGGVNEWLRWLPVSFHKKLDCVVRRILGNPQLLSLVGQKMRASFPAKSGENIGLSSVLEADADQIATMARETFER